MHTRLIRNLFLLLSFATLMMVLIAASSDVQAETEGGFTDLSEYSTLTATEAPSPIPEISPEAQKALASIAQREGISIDNLIVANEFRRNAPLLSRDFQAVSVLNRDGGRFFHVLVDRDSGQVEEQVVIEAAEKREHQARYGKLLPALFERLQQLKDTDIVTVTIVVAAGPGQSQAEREMAARAVLSAKYPAAREAIALHHTPMDVEDPALAEQIYREYFSLMRAGLPQQIEPLIQALEAQGFSVRTNAGLPVITAGLPKKVVQQIALREDVGTIFLSENGEAQQAMSWSTKTNRAPTVWARGFDGTGSSIAILDLENVDFDTDTGLWRK